MPELLTPARGRRDEAPEQTAAENKVLAAKPIADKAGQGRAAGIHPHEGGADQAEFHLVETEFLFEFRKDRENGLAIRVVEETDEPEHGDDAPFVRFGFRHSDSRI